MELGERKLLRKTVSGIMLSLLLISTLALAFNIQPVKAGTIIVPDDYTTIQEAINHASEGDTIYVKTGIYYEHVVVNKSVSLVGESKETTIIDGNGTGTVVYVNSSKVLISNFTVQKSGPLDYYGSGIRLEDVSHCNITNNVLTNNSLGVYLNYSSNNSLSFNHAMNNFFGVSLSHSSSNTISSNLLTNNTGGMSLEFSSNNNTISHNNLRMNKGCAIIIHGCSDLSISNNNIAKNNLGIDLACSLNAKVSGNNLTEGFVGIYLFECSENMVSGNSIANYTDYGIALVHSLTNRFYHNNFINNTQQIYDISWDYPNYLPSINVWDDGYPSGGNYWSNYDGTDLYSGPYQNKTGSDGIGDAPYVIDANNRDTYPLLNPYLTPYNLTIKAHCGAEGIDVSVSITLDGNSTGFTTPHTFTDMTGSHTFTIPNIDASGHPFYCWSTDSRSTTIKVSSGLTCMAYYGTSDVAVTDALPSKTVVGRGYTIRINVMVANEGDYTETFNVTVYANTTIINQTQITLTGRSSITITLTWNTTGFAKGNYTIKAYAWPVQGETDITDNTLVYGTVKVTIPGDVVEPYFEVDIYDITAICVCYDSKIGDHMYYPNCDLDGNGIIDIFDVTAACITYGQKYP